jgi:16S rRNA (adenine1518-N6/adenine1519-N6)-dimethyltransferase
MRLTSPNEVRGLLAQLNFKPSRILGQNFLIDGNILDILLGLADLKPTDQVLEIGPGLGVLTGPLLERVGRLVAIEKDDVLHEHLVRSLGERPNFTLLHADALQVDLAGLLAGGINKVVANLPYSVGSRLLIELALAVARPERMVVTVQREVADRMVAVPGRHDFGVLSVFLQLDYEVFLRKKVSRNCFFPPPQVESALVELRRRPVRVADLQSESTFREVVKTCFSHRRKQLGAILRNPSAVQQAGLDPMQRPETLDVAEWIRLANAIPKGQWDKGT